MPQGPQGWGQLVMQQHMHEAEHIRPRTARTGHETQMLADVWQQSMDDDDVRLTEDDYDDARYDEDDDDNDVSIIEPHGHANTAPAVLQPAEEEEEEAAAAGDTFMVSPCVPMCLTTPKNDAKTRQEIYRCQSVLSDSAQMTCNSLFLTV